MKTSSLFLILLAGAAQAGPHGGVTLTGTVKLKGDPPKLKRLRLSCPHCAPLYPEGLPREDLVVDPEGRVRWAFVTVKSGLEGRRFDVTPTPVLLDQKGCRYEPRVLGLMAGQKLLVRNSDPHCHCTHALPFRNGEFNFSQPRGAGDVERTFEHPEVMIRVKDDVSPWMAAWIGVLDHPYFAVTGPDGAYAIRGLPPGRYTLAVWHEGCDPATREIEVTAGDSRPVDWTLERKKE
jgi:hypothetical protein